MLALDADYVVTDELSAELAKLQPEPSTAGYRTKFIYCINGRKLRSGIYPPVTVLYRRDAASYIQDGHTQRVSLRGAIEELNSPLLHDDRKPFKRWFNSQAHYTKLEAQKLLAADRSELEWTDRLRRWRLVAPLAMPAYCLIVRGGIFDGWPGFYYAFQRTTAELMLSVNLGHRFTRMKTDVYPRY